jgi:hypothetical protein
MSRFVNETTNRITLIAKKATKPSLDWNYARSSSRRLGFVDSFGAVRSALHSAITHGVLDIERVIVDRAASAIESLELLAALPPDFNGDLLIIGEDGTGFLSASSRGGARYLYQVAPRDVRFYLETHDLVTGRAVLEAPFLKTAA